MSENVTRQKNPHIQEAYEHFRSARRSMRESLEELLPKGFVEKRRSARREVLLGLRKMLDAAIERSEKKA